MVAEWLCIRSSDIPHNILVALEKAGLDYMWLEVDA